MDIFSFVNSRDIREHLKKLDYQFSSLEAAWLIWQNRYATLVEKHRAWNEIIRTMPDCEIEERLNTLPQPSLHRFLERLMEIENNYIEMVRRAEPNTFYSGTYASNGVWHSECPTQSYVECFETAVAYCRYDSETDDISDYRIRVRKVWFDGRDESIGVEVTPSGEILKILYDDFKSRDELDVIDLGFDGMCFSFPTPFKKGDILKGNCNCYEPFVYLELDTDSEARERLLKNGDYTDMNARGYCVDPDNGEVWCETQFEYMCFEYWCEELTGFHRVLKPLSSYLKGEIGVDLYTNLYRTIMAEECMSIFGVSPIAERGVMLS